MAEKNGGYIYILTNPSFEKYVKIGYATDVDKRLKSLNNSSVPFSFSVYATYKITKQLADKEVHKIFDLLDPELHAKEVKNGKVKKKEFFSIDPEKAYSILECMARIHGTEKNLKLVEPKQEEVDEQIEAEQNKNKGQLPSMDWFIKNKILKKGDEICLINHPSKIITVVDSKYGEYKGKKNTYNEIAKGITGWQAVNIYHYFRKVDGDETLHTLRLNKRNDFE